MAINPQHWQKILDFDLDTPPGEYCFSVRLAHKQSWTKQFTQAAILEYKKFMYLAATSDSMVGPSEIVDQVWHQHLIFTQSYHAFCELLGKHIQHVPSTHDRAEAEKFKRAAQQTRKLYAETFGDPPPSIWEKPSMLSTLNLPKARLKLRGFILLGIAAFVLLSIPFYYAARPVYVNIANPAFPVSFFFLAVSTFGGLAIYNHIQLKRLLAGSDPDSFIFSLQPIEMVYLKTQKMTETVTCVMNDLVVNEHLAVAKNGAITIKNVSENPSPEYRQVYHELRETGQATFYAIAKKLARKPVFLNAGNSMTAFRKYVIKSKPFARLFYLNFCILALLTMLASTRMILGIVRDKPVFVISLLTIITILCATLFLARLTYSFFMTTVPKYYETGIRSKTIEKNPQWDYALLGAGALALTMQPIISQFNGRDNNSFYGSCGSSCGSSCGGGGCGGGCGGCGS